MRINDPPAPGSVDSGTLRVTPDGRELVAAGGGQKGMMGYDLRTGMPMWRHPQPVNGNIFLDPTAGRVWAQEAGSGSSRLFAYDLATGERIAQELNGQHGTVCDVRASPDRRTVALASCNEGTIARWALDGRTATASALAPVGFASYNDLWSHDGRYAAVYRNGQPASLEVVDLRTGARRRVPRVVGSDTSNPYFRQDGILQGIDQHRHVVEFDPARGTTRDTGAVLPGTGEVESAAEDPAGGRTVYGIEDGTLFVVDTSGGRVERTISSDIGPVWGVAWSPDGRRVYAAGQNEHAEVIDARTWNVVAKLPVAGANLALSPDGALLAVNSFNGTITLFDTTTLRGTGDPLTGGTAFTRTMEFTPDGHALVTSGLDSTTRLFDIATRRQIGVSIPIASVGVAIAPDSKQIAVTTDQGVQRFAIDAATLRAAACRAAGRDLTVAEWRQYIGGRPHRLCA
jgi:WD40 repeat protein